MPNPSFLSPGPQHCNVEQSDPVCHWIDRTTSPEEEARNLAEMMRRTDATLDSIRKLIAVPVKCEQALQMYAASHPEDAASIQGILRFRSRVAEEFELITSPNCEKAEHGIVPPNLDPQTD